MQEVFLGFVGEDSDRAFSIVRTLASEGTPVFWQKDPEWAGSGGRDGAHSFAEYRVVIIIWSTHSAPRLSMRRLALDAHDQGKLLLVLFSRFDATLSAVWGRTKNTQLMSIPLDVGGSPIYNLATWRGSHTNPECRRLVADVQGRLRSE